jgi:hypothetical protein
MQNANIETPLSQLKSEVLSALHQYTKKELTHDDITMIALEIGPTDDTPQKEEAVAADRQIKAFNAFYDTACNNTILNAKTTLLIQMATAIAVGCYP